MHPPKTQHKQKLALSSSETGASLFACKRRLASVGLSLCGCSECTSLAAEAPTARQKRRQIATKYRN